MLLQVEEEEEEKGGRVELEEAFSVYILVAVKLTHIGFQHNVNVRI